MDLTLYDIIKGPRITEKAYQLNQRLKQLVLEVHVEANKSLVAEALKKLFNVEAEEIRMVVRKGKQRRVGKHTVTGKMRKKAIVTLKQGYSVDLMGLSNTSVEGQEVAQESKNVEER
jgi:large subunit ribosomal protein L23